MHTAFADTVSRLSPDPGVLGPLSVWSRPPLALPNPAPHERPGWTVSRSTKPELEAVQAPLGRSRSVRRSRSRTERPAGSAPSPWPGSGRRGDLILGEDRRDLGVQLARTLLVRAERLLDDHAGKPASPRLVEPDGAEPHGDRPEQRRRGGQVEDAVAARAVAFVQLGDELLQYRYTSPDRRSRQRRIAHR
jgi:hypothetical protein